MRMSVINRRVKDRLYQTAAVDASCGVALSQHAEAHAGRGQRTMAMQPPCASVGCVGCIASPMTVTPPRPGAHDGSESLQREQLCGGNRATPKMRHRSDDVVWRARRDRDPCLPPQSVRALFSPANPNLLCGAGES